MLFGDPARLQRAGDLVVVGDRDRPEAAVAGGLEQHLDRGRAVARVVGVHVQVDLDQRPLGDPLAHLRVAGAGRGGAPAGAGRSLPARRRPRPARDRRPPGADQLVGGREVALQQFGRRRRGHRAGIEPAEEDLDQRPRHLGREHPLLRRVEGGDVEREEWRSAAEETLGANGSWTWTMSRGRGPQQLFDLIADPGDLTPRARAAPAPPRPARRAIDRRSRAPPMRRDLDYRELLRHGRSIRPSRQGSKGLGRRG